jgi:hypothetical protein
MMKQKLTEHDHIFDGFAHRNFNPQFDGWRNELPDPALYPSLQMAQDIVAMFDELSEARRKIWHLEQELKLWRPG